MLLFVGTYTRKTDAVGIYALRAESDCNAFAQSVVNPAIDNPSWLVLHPRLPVLYAVNEIPDYEDGGAVSAFAYDEEGRLELLGSLGTRGADPCHLTIDGDGSCLMVSNYSSGSLATFALDDAGNLTDLVSFVQHDGHSIDPVRQDSAHVHSITLDGSGGLAYVADLGADCVYTYPVTGGHLDVSRRTSVRLRPGAGPRHSCFAADGEMFYVINELDSTIVSLGAVAGGKLVELSSVSTLPPGCDDASYCAHIEISKDGRYLYASNRGHDSIAVFELGPGRQPQPVQFLSSGGKHPRHFCQTPDGGHLIVANRDSDNLVVFERDVDSGMLTATGTEITVPAAVCIAIA